MGIQKFCDVSFAIYVKYKVGGLFHFGLSYFVQDPTLCEHLLVRLWLLHLRVYNY